jgi:uncharacterized membrane protein
MPAHPDGLGPVQLIVVAFEGGRFDGRVLEELRRLRRDDAVRLIDLLFVARSEEGAVVEIEQDDLSAEESTEFGDLIAALLGLGSDEEVGTGADGQVRAARARQNGFPAEPEDVWFLADAIPHGTSAAFALLEHRWASPLRDAIESAGGHDLDDRWIHPEDLAAIGAPGS